MRALLVLLVLMLLAGCSLFRPEVQIVKVPVSVPCLKSVPERPEYLFPGMPEPVTEVQAMEAAKALARDFERADLYGRQWEAQAAGCIVLGPP
jgi:hypothetical protein